MKEVFHTEVCRVKLSHHKRWINSLDWLNLPRFFGVLSALKNRHLAVSKSRLLAAEVLVDKTF